MAVRIKDIAKKAGVSEATVSLALNNSPLVKIDTKQNIKRIAKDMGYLPNAMARGLAKSRSGIIGLIVPDIESMYYGKLVKHMDDCVKEAGYSMVLAISNDKAENERQIINKFISQQVEGMVIAPMNQTAEDLTYIQNLQRNKIPFVFATAYYPGIEAPYVMVDIEDGTYRLVKYLLDMGHRNIVFLCGSRDVLTTYKRIDGYIRAFDERGMSIDDRNIIECTRIDYDGACEVTERLIGFRKDIDAIITLNDIMALGVLNVLKSKDLNVPGDVSLAGYDNVIFSSISPISITTINQDLKNVSRNAVNIIFNGIKENENINDRILIKPELIIRDSTGLVKGYVK